MMDVSTMKDWAAVFATTLGFGTFAVNLWARHVDKRAALRGTYDVRIDTVLGLANTNAKRLDKLEGQNLDRRLEATSEIVSLNTTRINRLEVRMESVATRDDVAKVDKSVVALGGQLDVLCERLKPIVHTTERLQEYLLDPAHQLQGSHR